MAAVRPPGRIARALRRRGVHVAALSLGAMLLSSAVSLLLPRIYTAEAQLEVAATGGLDDEGGAVRLDALRERALSHDAFDAVAAELNLGGPSSAAPEPGAGERREALLAGLRDRTAIIVRRNPDGATVTLTHRDGDAETAARVVSALADYCTRITFDEPVVRQEARVEELTKLAGESRAASERAAKEAAEYRAANGDLLAGAAKQLQATRDEKRELRDVTIAKLDREKKEIEELLVKEKQFETVTTKEPDAGRLADVDERIASARAIVKELTTVQKKADSDPEVIAQRARLTVFEEERRKLLADAPPLETRQPNEHWAQLSKARLETQSRLDAATRRLKLLTAAEKEQEELARRAPEVEAKAGSLDAAAAAAKNEVDARTADVAKAQGVLDDLRSRGSLSIRAGAPPVTPDRPAGPGALVLAAAGLLAGALAGLVSAFVAERMDHSFHETGAVAHFLGVATVGAIHVIETPSEAAQRRRARRKRSAALACLAIASCLVMGIAVLGDTRAIAAFVKSMVG